MMYDTGPTDLVLPMRYCVDCGGHTLFEPAGSRNFSRKSDVKIAGVNSAGATTVSLRKSEVVNCTVNSDTVRVRELTSSRRWIIFCTDFPEAFQDIPMNGIMGMGVAPRSTDNGVPTFWALYYNRQLAEPVVSFYFFPGSVYQAELTLGGVNKSKIIGDLIWTDLNRNASILFEAYTWASWVSTSTSGLLSRLATTARGSRVVRLHCLLLD